MELPTVTRLSFPTMPPLYAWPRFAKRALLVLTVVTVVGAYALLAGGALAALALLAEIANQ
jgi:hypothetical protein